MRPVKKGKEPIELQNYRSLPGAVYDGPEFTPVKSSIRRQLLKEQGYLCAYCMKRITESGMKIEHWQNRKRFSEEELVYSNLLGCCTGNEGHPFPKQHCDTRKGDSDLSLNPARTTDHNKMKIHYSGDGTIMSENEQFNKEINRVLNLNWIRLKSNRKAVLDAVMQLLAQNPGQRTAGEIRRLKSCWKSRNDRDELQEYCDVAIYYLDKKQHSLHR